MQSASSGSLQKQYDSILSLPLSGAEVKIDGDSDSEMRKVPEVSGTSPSQTQELAPNSRKRGPTADKEHKRLKRLLRNRVSAQQARERKKAYVVELEAKARELELRNAELEERVNTLQKETFMLRQVVKSMKSNGSTAAAGLEQQQHQQQ